MVDTIRKNEPGIPFRTDALYYDLVEQRMQPANSVPQNLFLS